MIFYGGTNTKNYYSNNSNTESDSCFTKIKSYISQHFKLFLLILSGIIILIVIIVVLCVVLTKKSKKDEEIEFEEVKIFPLEESSKSEVMEIYNNIGSNDKSTLDKFSSYLSSKASNLKEEQKVYLAYYWIIQNIKYDYAGLEANTVSYDAPNIFLKRTTVCSGYSELFQKLLLDMNYTRTKIKFIQGYSKGAGYSEFTPPISNHEWNAVEINGKWCLIDTTWDAGSKSEYYLCTPPKCFVRDHLPDKYFNISYQFLDNPLNVEQFHERIHTREGYCKYNLEIIEDKAIQNMCGRGKVTIKYKNDLDDNDMSLTVSSYNSEKFPAFFVNRINKGFEVDLSINQKGISCVYLLINYASIGPIYFNCTKEPEEKFYFPYASSTYAISDAQLISPMQRDLIKGQSYNFEIRTNDFEELIVRQGQDKIQMTKNGNIFKGENIYIHDKSINIYAESKNLLTFSGVGDDVDFPEVYTSSLKLRLYQPLIGTLTKGKQYKFEIKCESVENIRIIIGKEIIEMDRNNNIYSKSINIDSTVTESHLYVTYLRNLTNYLYDYHLYGYKIE